MWIFHSTSSFMIFLIHQAEAEVIVESSNVDVVDKIVVSGYDVKVSSDNSHTLLFRSHTWLHHTKNCWTYIYM